MHFTARVAACLRSGQSNIDTSQPYAFSVYHPRAPHCSSGWPWAKPNDPTLCSVLNATKQTAEESFADQMVRHSRQQLANSSGQHGVWMAIAFSFMQRTNLVIGIEGSTPVDGRPEPGRRVALHCYTCCRARRCAGRRTMRADTSGSICGVPHKRTEMDTRQRNHDTWILRDWLVHWGSATPVCYLVEEC